MRNATRELIASLLKNHIHPATKIAKRLELPHSGCSAVIHGSTIIGDDAIIF
jgi:serine acetyltransferase